LKTSETYFREDFYKIEEEIYKIEGYKIAVNEIIPSRGSSFIK